NVFPFVDLQSKGSVRGLLAALNDVLNAGLPKDVKIMSGHSAVISLEDLRSYRDTLDAAVAAVQKALQSGKTVAQLQQEQVLAKWEAMGKGFIKTDAFIATVAEDLAAKK